jgi:CRISPR-associated endonuclease/helicase Cas3
MGDAAGIASEVRKTNESGTRTIVVVNTVKRACELFEALNIADGGSPKKVKKSKKTPALEKDAAAPAASNPKVVLLHSRFRPEDRKRQVSEALAEIKAGDPGTIVVSTQVVEAGVDVSATRLFTELAPWASLVQRFGRCNRRGEDSGAQVLWIDLPDNNAEKLAPPYELDDLNTSKKRIEKLTNADLNSLPTVALTFEHTQVLRRKDLIDLFDTTPDLAGNDIDIDRFVRELEDSDVRVFWRDYGETPKETEDKESEPVARPEELCPAPIGEFRNFAKSKKRAGKIWRWNFLDKQWERAGPDKITPGQVFLVHADAGGYSAGWGWNPDSQDRVEPIDPPVGTKGNEPDATEGERVSRIGIWQTIETHTGDVCAELDGILGALFQTGDQAEAVRHAARWHDRGKAHPVFQNAIDDGQVVRRKNKTVTRRYRPPGWSGCRFVAKAPNRRWENGQFVDLGFWRRYDWLPNEGRKHFRHELASALAVQLAPGGLMPAAQRDLISYLVAAHHGKVRLSIRSLPHESRPDRGRRFARGVWDGDELPATELGGGVTAPGVTLSLEPMELGLCEEPPFAGQPSWAERMIGLRDQLGPFRLAYLETILRAADMRASKAAEQRETAKRNVEARKETVRG